MAIVLNSQFLSFVHKNHKNQFNQNFFLVRLQYKYVFYIALMTKFIIYFRLYTIKATALLYLMPSLHNVLTEVTLP